MITHPTYFETAAELNDFFKIRKSDFFVLIDENTSKYCLPLLPALQSFPSLVLPAGENNKNIDHCLKIWQFLTDNGANRNSIIINIGGGVICDMGSFAASVFQRGIQFINVPTSLLAMVDAGLGGKTGINFNYLKNYIGTFQHAIEIVSCKEFLKTLPKEEIYNGWAEILKHGIISDSQHFLKGIITLSSGKLMPASSFIEQSAKIKLSIVAVDPEEKGERKVLNLGHTLGHALEQFNLQKNKALAHGTAVAVGILLETRISKKMHLILQQDVESIMRMSQFFPRIEFSESDIPEIADLCQKDKKNTDGQIRFSLPVTVGKVQKDVPVSKALIQDVLSAYWSENQ